MINFVTNWVMSSTKEENQVVLSVTNSKTLLNVLKRYSFLQGEFKMYCHQVPNSRKKLVCDTFLLHLRHEAAVPPLNQGTDANLNCWKHMCRNEAYHKLQRSPVNEGRYILCFCSANLKPICTNNTLKIGLESVWNGIGRLFGNDLVRRVYQKCESYNFYEQDEATIIFD